MKKKLITATLLSVAALALVVASVLGTIAILSSSSAVSNVFTVGDVEITMFESKVNPDGQKINSNGEIIDLPETTDKNVVEVDANSYHLVPGKTYVKDPTIRILSDFESDQMYLFVKSRNQIRGIEEGNVDTSSENLSMRQQMIDNGWIPLIMSGDNIEIVWVYGTRGTDGVIVPTAVNKDFQQKRSGNTMGPKGEFLLCSEFTVDKNVADISLYAAAKVNFTAFAVQTSGMNDAKTAWESIVALYPYEGGIAAPKNPYNGSTEKPYEPVPMPPAP